MTPEEYQERMQAEGIGRGKLGPDGKFPLDYGPNPAVSHELHVFRRLVGEQTAAKPVALEDLSHLNPRESGRSRAFLKRRWAGLTVEERRAKAEQLRQNGRGNVARKRRAEGTKDE